MTRARRWTLRLLTAGLSLVVVFAALEIGLRLATGTEAAPTFQALFMSDHVIGYRLRPGAQMRLTTSEFTTDIRINSAGVRDEELGAKDANERRVVILGDSMVMGVQVPLEETFAKQLERQLNGIDRPLNGRGFKDGGLDSKGLDRMSGGLRYRVINAGVQGYGTVEEYLFFKEMIDTLQPDLVLLTVFVGNDAVEAGDAEWRLRPSSSTARQKVDTGWRWGRRLARRSATVQFLRQKLLTVSSPSGNAPLRDRPLDSYLEPAAPEVMHGFAVARECATKIATLAKTHGASTAVVLLPARFQVDEADFTRLSEAITRPGRTLVRDAATDRFRAVLDKAGPPVLDLLPVFRARSDAPDLFFRENVHLTARGHQVVAEALVPFLKKHALLKIS